MLRGHSICLNIHLDIKMVPVIDALVGGGARVLVLGCNPHTTRDSVAALMAVRGAEVYAWAGMTEAERREGFRWALSQGCEFVSEMGGELLEAAAREGSAAHPALRAGMEATGSGILRLESVHLPVPVFNWDGLTLKAGLHNRHLVGLMVWNTFLDVTALTLYARRVLVMGYGLVGQGIAEYARLLGASVLVCDPDPVRLLLARQQGCEPVALSEGLARAAVVITATGRERVLGADAVALLADGCILANAGHSNLEIDVPALRQYPMRKIRRGIQEIAIDAKTVYLLAEGAMLNLAAGSGDPLDAFDLTSALMLAGIEFMVHHYAAFPAGIHLLPSEVQHRIAVLATGMGQ
jgi:adenosylhomocysteinase